MKYLYRFRTFLVSGFWELRVSQYLCRPLQLFLCVWLPRLRDAGAVAAYYLLGRRHSAAPPRVNAVFVMPVALCNAKCVFCRYDFSLIQNEKPAMTQALFEKTIDEAWTAGFTEVHLLPTVGEVLLDKGLFEKIAYARRKGMTVGAFTNGILLDVNENWRRLVDAGLRVLTVSLSDLDPEIEAANYRISAKAARLKFDGIRKLVEYNNRVHGIAELCLAFRPSRNPYRITREPLFQELKKLKANYMFELRFDNWGGGIEQKALNGIMKLAAARKFKRLPCQTLRTVTVLPSGKLRACGCRFHDSLHDDLILGDLKSASFQEITTSGRLRQIEQRFADGDLPDVCKQCAIYRP